MRKGDTETISRVKNIVTIIILERIRGVTECARNVVAEALRMKAMEGNTEDDIFRYMPAGEMTNVPEVACGRKEVESVGLNSTETEEAEEGERGARESSKVSGSVDTWSTDRVKDAVAA